MALSELQDCPCPICGAVAPITFFASIGPEASEEILTDALQRNICAVCGEVFRTEPALTYLDSEAGLWICARPADMLSDWQHQEADALAAFEESHGDAAPKSAQDIGAALSPRLTFGWPALREKLMIAGHGLNDAAVEMTKLAILRHRPGNPVVPGVELRLLDVRGPVLDFAWLTSSDLVIMDVFTAQRRLYDSILTDPAWRDLFARLPDRGLVDLQRFWISPATDGP